MMTRQMARPIPRLGLRRSVLSCPGDAPREPKLFRRASRNAILGCCFDQIRIKSPHWALPRTIEETGLGGGGVTDPADRGGRSEGAGSAPASDGARYCLETR